MNRQRWVHVSDGKVGPLMNVEQVDLNHHFPVRSKPCGLWYSSHDEDGWCAWVVREDWAPREYRWLYSAEIDLSAMLVIDSAEKENEVREKFGICELELRRGPNIPSYIRNFTQNYIYDWYQVSQEYAGIHFQNYHDWYRDLSVSSWIRGVDCESGCVWNVDAIKRFELIDESYTIEAMKKEFPFRPEENS